MFVTFLIFVTEPFFNWWLFYDSFSAPGDPPDEDRGLKKTCNLPDQVRPDDTIRDNLVVSVTPSKIILICISYLTSK